MAFIPYIAIVLFLLLCLVPKTDPGNDDYDSYGDPQDYQRGPRVSHDDYCSKGDPQDHLGEKVVFDDYESYGDPQDY
jgi:hypothetical protein